MNIKTLTFYFDNGNKLQVSVESYIVQIEMAGIFIKEKVPSNSLIIKPEAELRTVKFIQMSNVNWIDFEY